LFDPLFEFDFDGVELAPWAKRVVGEHQDLVEKIKKLSAYISSDSRYGDLHESHQSLLEEQLMAMKVYKSVLDERIRLIIAES
jgi:hypothetical protein